MQLRVRGRFVGFMLLLVVALALPAGVAQADHRVLGVDVSSWQGSMNWDTAYNGGVRFAFVRSSRGGLTSAMGRHDDTHFLQNMQAIESLADSGKTIYAGAYHFSRPDLATLSSGQPTNAALRTHAENEALHFFQEAGDYMTPGWLRPVLDLEVNGTDSTEPLSRAKLSFWANAFMDKVEALSGAEPLVYMNGNYAGNFVDSSLAHRDLWIANWGPMRDPDGWPDPLANHYGPDTGVFDDWAFWQFSGDTRGQAEPWGARLGASSTDIDLNVANGDLDFVREFLIPSQSVPEPGVGLALVAGLGLLLRRR